MIAPLQKTAFEPDTVVFYGNPAQIMRCAQVWSYLKRKRVAGNGPFSVIFSFHHTCPASIPLLLPVDQTNAGTNPINTVVVVKQAFTISIVILDIKPYFVSQRNAPLKLERSPVVA